MLKVESLVARFTGLAVTESWPDTFVSMFRLSRHVTLFHATLIPFQAESLSARG